uniref:NAD(+) ADP-ribosyltransferase n=1 Tax=Caenorhabditis tropicalis TaxID=1561998 RepID=A0A1I7U268_9PELO
MANAHLPYSIEYAKHSNCKRCCESIPEGSLRCSINRPAYHSEGYIDSWYHYDCFWKKLVRGKGQINISSIRGVDLIRWEDQEELRERIRKFKESRGCSYLSEEIYLHDVFIEPSFSNRGKCTKCSIYFQKGEIKVTHSVHFKCFIASFDKIHGKLEDMPRWKMISNKWRTAAAADFDEIMMAKQTQVKNEVVENTEKSTVDDMTSSSVTGKRRSSSDKPIENDSEEIMEQESEFARKRRLGKSARLALIQERKLEKQTDELRKNLQIFNSMSVPDRIIVLKENGQEVPEGGYDRNKQIVERLSDYALFGCPIHCVKCFNGIIVYNSSRRLYTCSGYVSEYTKCTYETKTPTQTPFILPRHFYEKYKLHDAVFNLMSERLYHKEEDSEEVLVRVSTPIKLSEEKNNSTQIIKNGTLVDAKFLYAGHCHVLKNEDDGTIYQATLSLADLTTNKNSFYKMQLLQDDITKHCYLFKSWGRVGTDVGSSNYDCECNKEYAIAKFEQLFHEKTGNEWKYRKYFRKMPGRYNQVETDDSEIIEIGEQYVAPGSKTCLPQSVKEVVMTIFNIGNMETALKFFKMDTNKMPLGCLSRNQINSSFQCS